MMTMKIVLIIKSNFTIGERKKTYTNDVLGKCLKYGLLAKTIIYESTRLAECAQTGDSNSIRFLRLNFSFTSRLATEQVRVVCFGTIWR